MVNKRRIGWLYLVALWALITALAWPAYVLCSTLIVIHDAEGWQLDAWQLIPREQMLAQFLHGYEASLAVCASVGLVAVVDHLLLSRYRVTWFFGGILLPLTGLLIAFSFYRQPYSALPTLLAAGALLAFVYRLIERVAGDASGGPLL